MRKKSLIYFSILLLAYEPMKAEETMIVAHRGASKDAPENTLPAFRLAWEQGADAIEGDFHLTKDGHIVCIHDRDTKKVSDVNYVVRETTLEALRKLDVGLSHGQEFEGTRIPKISEVFATVPEGKTIYVEVKCGVEIIPELLEAIKRSGLGEEQIIIISFNDRVIEAVKAQAPQFKAFWLCSFKKRGAGVIKPSSDEVLNTLKRIQADGLSSNTSITASLIRKVRQLGYQWHVWTVDDPETARQMEALGAKSITTNVPAVMEML